MRIAYRILADLIAIGVAFQAATAVWATAGLYHWISAGGVLDKAVLESPEPPFPEGLGLALHEQVGEQILPLLALALLVVSFFAKIPTGIRWAVVIFVLVVLQAFFGLYGDGLPLLGLLHGLTALAIFMVSLLAVNRSKAPSAAEAPAA